MNHRRLRIFLFTFLSLIMLGLVTIASVNSPSPPQREAVPPKFVDVEEERIRTAFIEVLEKYKRLHPYEIVVKRSPTGSSTMQAQPIITFKSLFNGNKRYTVKLGEYVRYSDNIAIRDVPEDVLKGWFAHELGHLVDYQDHSNAGMIRFGLKYMFSDKFKRDCEFEADSIAIEHGFHREIIATKNFLMENDRIAADYREKLRKFYMPVQGVRLCLKKDAIAKQNADPKIQ